MNQAELSHESLENMRIESNKWLQIAGELNMFFRRQYWTRDQANLTLLYPIKHTTNALVTIASDSLVLRTSQCTNLVWINMPPPYMEMHWRHSSNGSFDEMDMEEMFEKQTEELEYGAEEDLEMYEDDEEGGDTSVWTFNNGASSAATGNSSTPSQGRMSNSLKHRLSGSSRQNYGGRSGSDDDDGLDIQSLSKVTGEYMYGGMSSTEVTMDLPSDQSDEAQGPKKIVNLDSNVIKVIVKEVGKVFLVRYKQQHTLHALKVLKKDFIIRKNQVEHTKTMKCAWICSDPYCCPHYSFPNSR